MNTAEHYLEAEKCLERASKSGDADVAKEWIAEAQVHATLALAGPAILSEIKSRPGVYS